MSDMTWSAPYQSGPNHLWAADYCGIKVVVQGAVVGIYPFDDMDDDEVIQIPVELIVELLRLDGQLPTPDALRAERDRLRVCIVEMAIPYEALRLDAGSRKWIAPVVWQHIIDATTAARAALPGGTE